MVATLDFESFVASVIREKFAELDKTAADAREQQGIAQKGLGNRVISNTQIKTDDLPPAEKTVSTATRVLNDMSDPLYYQPDEFPTQEVRVDRAPRFSSINRSTVLDILSANRDGLEKQGIVNMPMGMLRKPDPTLDIDGLQSRILDRLDLRTPEGSPQDIQYGAELGKLGRLIDNDKDVDVDTDAPAGEAQDNQPNVADAEPSIRVGVKTGLGARTKAEVENIEDMPPLGAGDPIRMATEFSITDDDDNFSQDALSNAMSSIQDNPWYSALVLGTSAFETGGDGLVDEKAFSRENIIALPSNSRDRRRLEAAGIVTADNKITNLYSPEAVFNARYGNRADLGNTQEGDGNRFKGRGLVQLTGRRNYTTIQNRLAAKGIDIDLVGNPELANDPRYALPIALSYLQSINEQNAKEMGPYKLTRLINIGEEEPDTTRRWTQFTANLTGTDAMDARLSDEKAAQRTAGVDVIDGIIGRQSIAAMREYLIREGTTIPENATPYDLVRLVNGAGVQG